MDSTADRQTPGSAPDPPRKRGGLRVVTALLGAAFVYLAIAYVLLPLGWKRYEQRHPWLDQVAGLTETKDGIPGDPLNVAIIGTETELREIFRKAGWDRADPLGLRSDVRIATDTVLGREYADAPVSNLYLFGRKEDLAFEQPVGGDPRRRHHVRLWRANRSYPDGRPVWLGSATYDQRVGLSHTTGEITHHIAPDVDVEREHLLDTLGETGAVVEQYFIDNFHSIRSGRNGGGDPWRTDGRLAVGLVRSAN